MDEFSISDRTLEGVIGEIVAAERVMLDNNVSRPKSGFESLTGIAGEVDLHLRGLQVARAALADAAKTSGRGVHQLMEAASALDSELAASLNAGFAVKR